MLVLVGTFNEEEALVIVKTDGSFAALELSRSVSMSCNIHSIPQMSKLNKRDQRPVAASVGMSR